MAHAGSGSAFPAKSGGLKFSDVVRERFRGPAFGQDFTTWLNDVYLGFESAHVPESSQATHLVAFLESPVREIANAYLIINRRRPRRERLRPTGTTLCGTITKTCCRRSSPT